MKVAKEIFIMALLLMIVVFMIGLVFYEYMPNNKVVPDAASYSADSSTTSILQEIAATTANSGDDTDGSSGIGDTLLQSYSIGSDDLSTAASKHSYTSGKTNPFAEYVDPNVNMVNGTTTNGTTTAQPTTTPQQAASGSVSNKNSGNSGSISTGSFYEIPNSKYSDIFKTKYIQSCLIIQRRKNYV